MIKPFPSDLATFQLLQIIWIIMVNHVCSVISDEHCIQREVRSSYPGCANERNKSRIFCLGNCEELTEHLGFYTDSFEGLYCWLGCQKTGIKSSFCLSQTTMEGLLFPQSPFKAWQIKVFCFMKRHQTPKRVWLRGRWLKLLTRLMCW